MKRTVIINMPNIFGLGGVIRYATVEIFHTNTNSLIKQPRRCLRSVITDEASLLVVVIIYVSCWGTEILLGSRASPRAAHATGHPPVFP